jgi:hypothetical protein
VRLLLLVVSSRGLVYSASVALHFQMYDDAIPVIDNGNLVVFSAVSV